MRREPRWWVPMTDEQRRARNREKTRRYRARHRDRLLAERREKRRKPCPDCGGPKPPGAGIHRCPECEVAHKKKLREDSAERRRKPCRVCGELKPPGAGYVRCENCSQVYISESTGRARITTGRSGRYLFRYRQVLEEHLGRALRPDEVVHHINGDPLDDRIENLQLMSPEEHGRLHGIQSGEVRRKRAAA